MIIIIITIIIIGVYNNNINNNNNNNNNSNNSNNNDNNINSNNNNNHDIDDTLSLPKISKNQKQYNTNIQNLIIFLENWKRKKIKNSTQCVEQQPNPPHVKQL